MNKRFLGMACALVFAPMLAFSPMVIAQTAAPPGGGGARAGDPEPGRTAEQTREGAVPGPTGLAGAMPMADVEMGLQQGGFTDYEVIEYTVRGMRDGQPVTVRVDATSGQVIE